MSEQLGRNIESASSSYDTDAEKVSNSKTTYKKRKTSYNKNWEMEFTWAKSDSNSPENAHCIICKTTFKIIHGGKNDIKKHGKSDKHKKLERSIASSSKVSAFFSKSDSQHDVVIAELLHCYHLVNHSLSYRSGNCTGHHGGLYNTMFHDSAISKQFACARDKSAKVIKNVLGPMSKQALLKDLANGTPFSIATDASNKGLLNYKAS